MLLLVQVLGEREGSLGVQAGAHEHIGRRSRVIPTKSACVLIDSGLDTSGILCKVLIKQEMGIPGWERDQYSVLFFLFHSVSCNLIGIKKKHMLMPDRRLCKWNFAWLVILYPMLWTHACVGWFVHSAVALFDWSFGCLATIHKRADCICAWQTKF